MDPHYPDPHLIIEFFRTFFHHFFTFVLSSGFLKFAAYLGFGLTVWQIVHPNSLKSINSNVKGWFETKYKDKYLQISQVTRSKFLFHLIIELFNACLLLIVTSMLIYVIVLNVVAIAHPTRWLIWKIIDVVVDIPFFSCLLLILLYKTVKSLLFFSSSLLYFIDSDNAIGGIGAFVGLVAFIVERSYH